LKQAEIIKNAKKEQEFIKPLLKDFMNDKQKNRLSGENFVVTLSKQTRETMDKSKVQEMLGDDFSKVLKKSEFEVLKVLDRDTYNRINRMLHAKEEEK
jgi:RNase P protein component